MAIEPVEAGTDVRGGWLGVVAAGLVVGAMGCGPGEAAGPAASVSAAADPVVDVDTVRVRRGSVMQRISAPGTLHALRESRIGPEVAGRIERIFAAEGDRVDEGAPLFQIDPEPYELALRQAEARLDRAGAERRQIEADLARGRKLRRQEILADQQLDRLETSLAVARAAEREAKEAVAIAERNLERTLVRAPYAASVAARLEDEGTTALVRPQTIVLVLQESSGLEAHATIPEVHFAAIAEGDVALLHIDGLPAPIQTEVSAVSDAIDPATRTYLVKMRIENTERRLKAGVFARVEILPRAKRDVIVVPTDAIRRQDGRASVLVVRDGRAAAVPVEIGVVAEDAVEILHGVRVDDEVIVGEAARSLGPGMRVRAAGASAPAPS